MDVLRIGKAHARKPAELRIHLLNELLLGESAGPLPFRFQLDEELDVVERRDVRAVVGTAQLRDDVRHDGKAGEDATGLLRQPGRCLERDVHGQRGPHPEVPFLQLGHEFTAHQFHQQKREGERPTRGPEHGPPTIQDCRQHARVPGGQPVHHAGRCRPRPGVLAQPRREHRSEHQREQQRSGQREPVGEGHRRENLARHSAHREQREKRDEDHDGREEHGFGRFGRGIRDRVEDRLLVRPAGHAAVHVFHDHHRGIDQNAEVDGTDRDEVRRIPGHDHQAEGEQHRHRDSERGNEGHAHVAQEDQEQAGHQGEPEQHEVPHGAGGHVDQVGAVVDGVQLHARWESAAVEGRQVRAQQPQGGQGLLAALQQDDAFDHVAVAIHSHPTQPWLKALLHGRHVLQEYRHAAALGDDHVFHVIERLQ